jgi:hypothetical protein
MFRQGPVQRHGGKERGHDRDQTDHFLDKPAVYPHQDEDAGQAGADDIKYMHEVAFVNKKGEIRFPPYAF